MADETRFYLKQWRQKRGLTQEEIADAIDTSKGYISQLERGDRRYNQDILEQLAGVLEIEPADLLRAPDEAGEIEDPDLQKVIELWPRLLQKRRSTVANVAEGFAEPDRSKFEEEGE